MAGEWITPLQLLEWQREHAANTRCDHCFCKEDTGGSGMCCKCGAKLYSCEVVHWVGDTIK